MKNLALTLLLLATLLPLHADEFVRNGDFKEGSTYWDGNVKSLSGGSGDPDSTSLSTAVSDATNKQGILIELKKFDWAKVTQDFDCKCSSLTVTVTIAFSADTTFSENAEDYSNVTHAIGFDAWGPLKIPVGSWMLMLSDLSGGKGKTGELFHLKPKAGSTGPFTFTAKVDRLQGETSTTKTLTFAFPPGQGTATITHVSVTGTPTP